MEQRANFESAVQAVGTGQVPGVGSAQNDLYTFDGNVAVGFPLNCNYVIASNFQRLLTAKLSLKLLPFRTYNTFSATATGAGTAHAHGHLHPLAINGGIGGIADMIWDAFNLKINKTSAGNVTDSSTVQTDATTEAAHTHPISVSSVLGIFEGATATGVTVVIDGVDRTVALGGPFNTDMVEVNIAKYLPITTKLYHTIALVGTGLGRIQALLRITYYVNAQVQN